jgi:hypothetical protein
MRVIGILLLLSLSACDDIASIIGAKEKPIARVFDKELLPSDLINIVPKGTSKNDSIEIVKAYVENWVKQEVILKQAIDNANLDQAAIDLQLANYKNSLVIYAYEEQLVAQKLDTTVSEKELLDFYTNNKDNFELKKSIVKVSFIKLAKNAAQLNLVKKWFNSARPRDKADLETYCMQFASDYLFADTTWQYLDDLQSKIPLGKFSEDAILQKGKRLEFSDANFIYLVFIKDFMYREETSPLSFEIDNIRNSIINKRKLVLINSMEQGVYQKAIAEKDIEINLDEKK